MSNTLAVIRRNIGFRTGQPFFKWAGATFGMATGGSTTSLTDTTFLHQADNTWRGSSVYLIGQQKSRLISASTQSTKTITWVEPTAAVTAGSTYEIWSQFSVYEVHAAINAALRDTWPFFFTQNTGYLVVQEGKAEYDLSSLSPAPKWLASVWLEVPESSVAGSVTASSGAQNRLRDDNANFTSSDIGKSVRIYSGTSAGDIRTITSVVSQYVVEVSSNFTATLTTTSKYRMVSSTDPSWVFTSYWTEDKKDNPTQLRLSASLWGKEGLRLRLLYEAEYPALSAESDSTTCPLGYLEDAAIARLYLTKLASAPASESKNWAVLQRAHAEAAQMFALKNSFRHLDGTVQWAGSGFRLPSDYPF